MKNEAGILLSQLNICVPSKASSSNLSSRSHLTIREGSDGVSLSCVQACLDASTVFASTSISENLFRVRFWPAGIDLRHSKSASIPSAAVIIDPIKDRSVKIARIVWAVLDEGENRRTSCAPIFKIKRQLVIHCPAAMISPVQLRIKSRQDFILSSVGVCCTRRIS